MDIESLWTMNLPRIPRVPRFRLAAVALLALAPLAIADAPATNEAPDPEPLLRNETPRPLRPALPLRRLTARISAKLAEIRSMHDPFASGQRQRARATHYELAPATP
jgi:hypothetical protein